jgi:hypothetical protein
VDHRRRCGVIAMRPRSVPAPDRNALAAKLVSGPCLHHCVALAILSDERAYMPTLVIRLADILTLPSDPTDLTALPPDEVRTHVRRIYGFLPKDAQVSAEDDVAVIDIPQESAQRAGRAVETHERDSLATIS